jgi:hypothetical protein
MNDHTVRANNRGNQTQTLTREAVRQRLDMALGVTDDPSTVFCVQPFSSVQRDGGELLGGLLARMMGDPAHSLLVATDKAFVFGFGDQLAHDKTTGAHDEKDTENVHGNG